MIAELRYMRILPKPKIRLQAAETIGPGLCRA